jgi:hypothetical protein
MSSSNNVIRADKQQERLILSGWIIGFVDGEGCFSINFIKQSDKKETNRLRRGYQTGFQVTHEFVVVQGTKSLDSLKKIQNFFQVGNIYVNRRHDNHKEHLYRYTVKRREDIMNVIIPFFTKYQLQTAKKNDFEKFKQCVSMIYKQEHLKTSGLIKIIKISETMNRQKSQADKIRILRNQTSATTLKKRGRR